MVTVNGRPAIAWILEELVRQDTKAVTVVVREDDDALQLFLRRAFGRRIALTIVAAPRGGTILNSLAAGLDAGAAAPRTRVVLGDTLIRNAQDDGRSFVYCGRVSESHRWCIVEENADGRIAGYKDKADTIDLQSEMEPPFLALAGYYHFARTDVLRAELSECLQESANQMSDLLYAYNEKDPIYAVCTDDWIDFGHIDTLSEARHRLLQPRYFNQLKVNPTLNTIRKVSQRSQKLRDEIDWYRELPSDLKVLTPRLISVREDGDQVELVQEHYGYPSLAELYVFGEIHNEAWNSILERLLEIHGAFRAYKGALRRDEFASIYVDKTFQRLNEFEPIDPELVRLFDASELVINGRAYPGWRHYEAQLRLGAEELCDTAEATAIHGDFCFSNILYDLSHQIVRLIDPRGRFGRKGVYGDPRYDLAKLRHSVCGYYDYIVSDMFDLSVTERGVEFEVFATKAAPILASSFDRIVERRGLEAESIRLIEALLFLSMLPLHADHPSRQKAMYVTAVKRMAEVFSCE